VAALLLRKLVADDYERIAAITLRTLEPLVLGKRIKLHYDAMCIAPTSS
jgi:hypothetical protein